MTGPARPRRRLKQPREDVMAAAMATIAERGLAELTIAGLGRQVGMSSGHVLYYFGSKEELLLQTLEWSEAQLAAERRRVLGGPAAPRERLDAVIDLYLPDGRRDPRWTLWSEIWNRTTAAEDVLRRQLDLELVWHRDLVALLAEGISRGDFRPLDPERFTVRLRALLDGFGVPLVIGLPGTDRGQTLEHVKEFLDDALTPAPAG
ncbi:MULTISPECIES: TetR/AcrR family transcriptional regulator [unclassified Streptomyces]|uniref:TetR/AcrR family transcriptional regulator n=1 Tax=unclassified Streptomyces TaxID=2593676 RepID=UPI00036B1245|nr:TetR/AcrR family transcriptional regulator [Streptomyces sp. BoleA5]MYX36278.1 TetR family transcriptional regulator [Streptomyces sp. SID8377]